MDFLWTSYLRSAPYFTVILAILLPVVFLGMSKLRSRLKKREEELSTAQLEKTATKKQFEELRFELEKLGTVHTSALVDETVVRVPPVPIELVHACASGSCVLLAGSGVAAQAGYPTWRETLLKLIDRASIKDPNVDWSSLADAIRRGRLAKAEDLINSRVARADLVEVIRELFIRPEASLPPFFDSLAAIPFAGVITPNWDDSVVRAFADYNPLVVLSSASTTVSRIVEGDRFFVLKLYGDPDHPETFRFTPTEYEHDLFDNTTYSKFLTSLFLSRSVFCLGASLKGLDDFFSGLKLREKPSKPHFALVAREPDMALQEELFLSKYGVRLLGYEPTPGFPEVSTFVTNLGSLVAKREPVKIEIRKATLNHVTLKNIGIFENLDLELNGGWNVLIGNNGCGKSTLLKAIALGLCGDDQKAADVGGLLLRQGADAGSIRLKVGDDEYLTELMRENDQVRVVCRQLTPLQRGNWVVLGFPAMRGVSEHNPIGPAGRSINRPVIHDLLPLIAGAVDDRLDNLKQWIVNVDARSRPGEGTNEDETYRNQQLRTAFFDLFKEVSPRNLNLEFDYVDKDFQIWVKIDDVSVRLDQISQGMSSMFGWVGTLLQRMYEIYRDHQRPEHGAAFVLVDEIDAHLHPEWQQLLVPLLKKAFLGLQVFATTHSPLIVAGMTSSEVWIARQNFESDRFEVVKAPLDLEGMRADQILTSQAFGLVTSRSLETRDDAKLYSTLLGRKAELETKGMLSEDEMIELRDLGDRLGKLEMKIESVRGIGENETQRIVEDAVRKAFQELAAAKPGAWESAREISPEEANEIKNQLAEIFTLEGEQR
jgi:energy-coupling factor transporter ATP-binding protein EcfA2